MPASDNNNAHHIPTSIAPWLSVHGSMRAVEFYKIAFGATETYRHETPDGGVVANLSIDGAAFWVSEASGDPNSESAGLTGGSPVRMILTVANPDAIFSQALNVGALEVFPVGEGHGWRLGRLADPFGLHWEIGHPLAE